jgi:hypothetical protein
VACRQIKVISILDVIVYFELFAIHERFGLVNMEQFAIENALFSQDVEHKDFRFSLLQSKQMLYVGCLFY